MKEANPQIIFLDQKDWIDLARGYYGKDPQLKKVSESIMMASQAEKAIFPLSITHLDETGRNLNDSRRARLVEYMVKVSKGNSISPAPTIAEFEIQDACLRYLGLNGYDLRKFAIGKGISHMVGAKPSLEVSGPVASLLTEDIKKMLLDSIETPEALQTILRHPVDLETFSYFVPGGVRTSDHS